MTFDEKVQQLSQTIKTAATALGLEFVSGPNTTPVSLDAPSFGITQGQPRSVYLFAVAND